MPLKDKVEWGIIREGSELEAKDTVVIINPFLIVN